MRNDQLVKKYKQLNQDYKCLSVKNEEILRENYQLSKEKANYNIEDEHIEFDLSP
jgi:hypothetical protein